MANFGEKEITSVGEAIHALPFEVGSVVFRVALTYEDVGRERHEKPISAVEVPPEQVNTIYQAFSRENLVGYYAIPVFDREDTREILENRYAQYQYKDNGAIGIQFDLNKDQSK